MYPNYCFKKPPSDFGYDVVYMPKNNYNTNGNQSHRSELLSQLRSQLRNPTKLCCDDLIALQALLKNNEQMCPTHNAKPQAKNTKRTVEFRLPPVDQQRQREKAGNCATERGYHANQQQQQQQQQKSSLRSDMPFKASEANREKPETDFFDVINKKFLDAVQNAVGKHYEKLVDRIDQVNDNLMNHQELMKQLNREVIGKIAEQNEASINQFKFIAQMLIDNQTIYYRALNQQQKVNHELIEEEEETEEDETENECPNTPSTKSYKQKPEPAQKSDNPTQQRAHLQHQLWQQQDHCTSQHQHICQKHLNSNKSCAKSSRPIIIRRSHKGVSTVSMPDLHRGSLFSTNSNSNTKPSQWTQSESVGSERKCRCQCPSHGRAGYTGSSRRRPCSASNRMTSMEDMRVHK